MEEREKMKGQAQMECERIHGGEVEIGRRLGELEKFDRGGLKPQREKPVLKELPHPQEQTLLDQSDLRACGDATRLRPSPCQTIR